MPIEELLNAKIESLNVFLSSSIPRFYPRSNFINYFEYHSYSEGYVVLFSVDGNLYHTERFYNGPLYNNLVSYLNKCDDPLTLKVHSTNDPYTYKLLDVVFPDSIKPTQSTAVRPFIPVVFKSKRCTNELYHTITSDRDLTEFSFIGVNDPGFQGQPMVSLDIILDSLQFSTRFSDLTLSDQYTVLNAIRQFTPLNGLFKISARSITLIRLAI